MTPQQVVEKYFELMDAAMSTGDPAILAERAALVSDDIEYRNMPLKTIRGIEEHKEWKSGFAGTEYMRGTVTHIAADNEWVLMRRDEDWRLNGVAYGGTVMGIMRVVDGKIVWWEDYLEDFSAWRNCGQMPEAFWNRWEQ